MNLPRLSVWYKASIDAIDRAMQRLPIVLNGAHIVGTPLVSTPDASCKPTILAGMTVRVATGTARVNGLLRAVAQTDVVLPNGPGAGLSRVDLIYIDNTGTVLSVQGNNADPNTPPGPQDPDLPIGAALVAILLIPSGTAALTAAMLYDARAFGKDDEYANRSDHWTVSKYGPEAPSEELATGTGAFGAVATLSIRRYSTGAGAGGTAEARDIQYSPGGAAPFRNLRRFEFLWQSPEVAAVRAYVFMTNESTPLEPSLVVEHIGVKNVNGVFSFTTGDGAVEEATALAIAGGAGNIFVMTFDGVAARCYVNGGLLATHRTRVPISAVAVNQVYRVFIINTAAVNKQMDVGHMRFTVAC